jgi:hypothetical protein
MAAIVPSTSNSSLEAEKPQGGDKSAATAGVRKGSAADMVANFQPPEMRTVVIRDDYRLEMLHKALTRIE